MAEVSLTCHTLPDVMLWPDRLDSVHTDITNLEITAPGF